ncbi:MAG: hypothetical protein AAF633_25295, partial [Chloroflexota bacterium]
MAQQEERKRDTENLQKKRRWRLITLLLISGGVLLWLGIPARVAQDRYLRRGVGSLSDTPIAQDAALKLGINLSFEQRSPEEIDEILGELADLGIEAIQHVFTYPNSNSPAATDWTQSDQIFELLSSYPTIKLVPLLDGDPATNYAPPDIDAYA